MSKVAGQILFLKILSEFFSTLTNSICLYNFYVQLEGKRCRGETTHMTCIYLIYTLTDTTGDIIHSGGPHHVSTSCYSR